MYAKQVRYIIAQNRTKEVKVFIKYPNLVLMRGAVGVLLVFEDGFYISGGVKDTDDFNAVGKRPVENEMVFETRDGPHADAFEVRIIETAGGTHHGCLGELPKGIFSGIEKSFGSI